MKFNQFIRGDAAEVLARDDDPLDFICGSPPYFPHHLPASCTRKHYLDVLDRWWAQCARRLRPDGKLVVQTALMPPGGKIVKQSPRDLGPLPFDIDQRILALTPLRRLEVFIWQKQTSEKMWSCYPYPGNALAQNTVEFIYVYHNPVGKPRRVSDEVKEASRISHPLWLDLTQQVWWIHAGAGQRSREVGAPSTVPNKVGGAIDRFVLHGRRCRV
jgi:modification methylase